MHTLLVRLAGPMQSWGTQSRFVERDTGQEPSKSGVLGLVCAALGRRREESVDDLAALRMGVRVDREGVMRRDFHSALEVAKADGGKPGTVVSQRYYLADADFLVGLCGEDLDLLTRIDAALAAPRWPLFLGRKAFVPGMPPQLPGGGMRTNLQLAEALKSEVWTARPGERNRPAPRHLRAVLETSNPHDERRHDQLAPGATFADRQFMPRFVLTEYWEGIPVGGESND